MNTTLFALLLVICLSGCRKAYDPPVIVSPASYLVVEGVINSDSDSTIIRLSRTVNIGNRVTFNPVIGCVLTVESDANATYPLSEVSSGRYACAGLNLDNSHKYRLDIKTHGEEYQSNFEPVLNAPPIDSVNYKTVSNGLNIFVNTHDPTNTIKYYRWDYTETWIYSSNYDSYFVSNGDTVLARTPDQQVYTCWPSDTSTSVIINSTARLSKSVIYQNPITSIASTSNKIAHRYSIRVNQYALTNDAYKFWGNLKNNTEDLGSIFDAQPSQINGNIHSLSNPNEPVIGFISVGYVAKTRIFIDNSQLPNWLPTPQYPPCYLDTLYYRDTLPGASVVINEVDLRLNYNNGGKFIQIPVNAVGDLHGIGALGYSASTPACVDCTLQGPNMPPAFWK